MKEEFDEENYNYLDLIPGTIYCGGKKGTVGDDPISKLLKVGNSAGMRSKMTNEKNKQAYMVIINNESNKRVYPNIFNYDSNILLYYGDQSKPNLSWKDTKQKGNIKMYKNFQNVFGNHYENFFPIFYFEKIKNKGRDYRYIGMAYPNNTFNNKISDVLKEVITVSNDGTVTNLIFEFIVDRTSIINRKWINSLIEGNEKKEYAPESWKAFTSSDKLYNFNIFPDNFEQLNDDREEKIITNEILRIQNQRIGQNKLREELIKTKKNCQLCGIAYKELLEAAHIIPWSDSELDEVINNYGENSRGDINNGLLLCSNHHKLLDSYLISVDENDYLVISDKIKQEHYHLLELKENIKIELNLKSREYLKYHKKIFDQKNGINTRTIDELINY